MQVGAGATRNCSLLCMLPPRRRRSAPRSSQRRLVLLLDALTQVNEDEVEDGDMMSRMLMSMGAVSSEW